MNAPTDEGDAVGRGRQAASPDEIPAPGWRDILIRVKQSLAHDQVSIIAAGVAFYALLALFPGIGVMVSIYGLLFDPTEVSDQLGNLAGVLPREALNLLLGQLRELASTRATALGLTALGSLLLTLWSAAKGAKTLMQALNVAYNENEDRGFLRLNGTALGLTLCIIIGAILAVTIIVALPALADHLPSPFSGSLRYVGWPILAILMAMGLSVLYRYGPNRRPARWQWVSWGAAIATLLWLLGSALFSFYAVHFGNYNKTYGSVGAVVILLMWLFISAYVVLIGAEINAEMERQTRKDTTVGRPKPLGHRDAYAADTVGPSL